MKRTITKTTNRKPVSDPLTDFNNEFRVRMHLYESAMKEIVTKLEILDEEFSLHYSHNPIHHIDSRLKSARSIAEKLERRDQELSIESACRNLNDIAGVRVICNYLDDVRWVSELLLRQDDIHLLARRNYIDFPKPNGYRSLHLIVEVPVYLADRTEYVKAEIQIRTIAMDFWATLEHHLRYKSEGEMTEDLRRRLRKCAESIFMVDHEMQSIYKEMHVIQQLAHKVNDEDEDFQEDRAF